MIHVPGQYSGGTSDKYTWTQTKAELEVRVPLPDSVGDGAVSCEIAARSFQLEVEGGEGVGGELSAVVVKDDSLWTLERDGPKAVAVLSLRKAVPQLWSKLLSSDDEPTASPQLLDGIERKKPTDKQELLRQAKERVKGALDGPSKTIQHVVEEKSGEKLELTTDNLPPLPVVTMRKCTDCEIVIAPGVAAVKLMIEGCSNTTVSLDGKVLTETLEVWGCNSCTVKVSSPIKTVQVDACQGLALQYERASDFDRCLSAGAFQVSLTFADSPALNGTVDLAELRAQMPGKGFSAETDQFITRHVDGALLTELIIRLSNDFPTTEREVLEFASKTRMQKDKLDDVVNGMLGSSLGKNLTEAERAQMVEMVQSQSEAAAAAQKATESTAVGRHSARVDFKKKTGNEAFKGGDYQQAAVAYTEALALISSAPRDGGEEVSIPSAEIAAIHCNRAACFLKLGRYAQAHDDARIATELQPMYAKAHFRLALALQAEEDFASACSSFNKTLQLEPRNKEAQAGLRMAEVQAERQRRQQAT